jgi:hypothetical protein
MPKYRFKFKKKTIHLIIPHHDFENMFDISLKGIKQLPSKGVFTEDELKQIGNIPMGTLMNMFRLII